MEGTYQLPEAQLDRFFFKVVLDYPSESELVDIFARTTAAALPAVTPVLDRETAPARIARLRSSSATCSSRRRRALGRVARAPDRPRDDDERHRRRHVTFGASPRGGQALLLGAKVTALLEGRPHVTPADVERVAHAALGHRPGPRLRRGDRGRRCDARRRRGARGGARGRP
jgi:MoxR-like ATPase